VTFALLETRAKLWWRRSGKARLSLQLLGFAFGGFLCFTFCMMVWGLAGALREEPRLLAAGGGPLAVFAAWLSMVLLARVWVGLLPVSQPSRLFDLRRFRIYPVSPRLLSAVNFAALFLEPAWLLAYPVLVVAAVGLARLPGAPPAPALLAAEAMAVFAVGGLIFFFAAVGASFESRPRLRRTFSAALILLGVTGLQLSTANPKSYRSLAGLFAHSGSVAMLGTPPGWAARFAQALADGQALRALGSFSLLALFGVALAFAGHAVASADAVRPPEQVQAGASTVRAAGWRLPLVSTSFSALFEKEAKTAIRAGWLQLVLVPVAYLLMVKTVFTGPEPLLVAAVYAHLSVLDLATNAFGRDTAAARAWFLWPLSLRQLLAAKNAVAFCFSSVIFWLLALVAASGGHVVGSQVLVGWLAHAATFPLLAAMGNAISVFAPQPVRGMRLRRVRGAGPVGARLLALGVLAGAVWAPYAIARATGLHLVVAYTGELIAMTVAYLGTLSAGARLLDSRREPLLAALSQDDEI
jgi:hypothetical protein